MNQIIRLCLIITMLLLMLPVQSASAEQAPAGLEASVIGYSVQGRPILVYRLGWGTRSIVITGAIHGNETNTADLSDRLLTHFAANQHLLPPDTSLYIIPVLNPDGFSAGSRYNANNVDLNRNWDSGDWQADTRDASGTIVGGGGSAPFSEPESAAFAGWLLELQSRSSGPLTTLMYHAQYPPNGLVLSGSVGVETSRAFAAIVGYTSSGSGSFSAYPITGEMIGWCHNQQMRCFELELPNRSPVSPTSMIRHATAILSVLLWEQIQPGQRCFGETGACIAGPMRAFWERHGGLATFGLPLTRQDIQGEGDNARQVQWFERVRLELPVAQSSPEAIQLGRLGIEYMERLGWEWWLFPRSSPRDECLFIAETEHNICGAFLTAFQSTGLELDGQAGKTTAESLALLGLPVSDAYTESTPDGYTYTIQWFERARLELHADTDTVRLGLLGRELLAGQ